METNQGSVKHCRHHHCVTGTIGDGHGGCRGAATSVEVQHIMAAAAADANIQCCYVRTYRAARAETSHIF